MTVFKKNIWVSGGRTDRYPLYDLRFSIKAADVWNTADGAKWTNVASMTGDYWAQNFQVVQPGPIAPWYQRDGHTMDMMEENFRFGSRVSS